ncbi:MAG: S-layer homology domain-containing protein, partial [Firmicutes bacterium]|nr:S-layer homology domain-containing protein [Bacillota bacterium]
GGSSDSQNKSAVSLGLRTNRVTASDNAKIEAMGETAASRTKGISIGANVSGDIELTFGATMTAVAGSVQSKSPEGEAESYGLEVLDGSVDLSDGAKLTASGGPVYGSNASSFSIGAKILEEDLTISDGYVAVRGYGKKSDSEADVDQESSFGLKLQGKLTVGKDGLVSVTGGDATVESCGLRCEEAQIDGAVVSGTKQAPREIGMDVTGVMTVGKTGDVQSYISYATSESYGIAIGKPMTIDGGVVFAVGYMKDGDSEENTTNSAIYYYGGAEVDSDPAVIMKNEATLWVYSFYEVEEEVADAKKATAVNGEVDLSAYGDYCWKSNKTEDKYCWAKGIESPTLSGGDIELLMIQSYLPVNLRPNGGTVEKTTVRFGPEDTVDDLPTPERSGYTFLGWYTEPEGGIRVDSDFVFDEEWTLYAHWKKKSSSSSGSSSGGSTIDQPVEPDPSVDETGDSDADCDHGSDCPLNQFDDVNGDAWYRDGIDFCVTNGLMSGTGDKTFAPDRTASRAMLVTILYQLEGRPEAGDNSFMDVNDGTWYFDAVSWAADFGIAGGIGNDRFAPDQALTREQLAVILYQYAKYKGYDVSVDGEADLDFADSADVSGWAQTALKWAVQNKLINGVGSDRLSPKGQATRAQLATILYQFCQIFVQNVTK